MKFKLVVPVLLYLGSVSLSWADTGTSHNFLYINKITDTKYFVGRGNLVTRDGFNDLFFGYVDANLRFKLNASWYFEAGYRQAQLKLSSGWRTEYRPHLNIGYSTRLGDWDFRNRHRLEARYFEGAADDHFRYRNESVIIAPFKVLNGKMTPSISEEFFYEFTDNGLTVNWLTISLSNRIFKNKKIKLGYRLQTQKFGGEWKNRHVLVTSFSILNF